MVRTRHDIESIPRNSTRATCTLCGDGNTAELTTRYSCGTCLVPLKTLQEAYNSHRGLDLLTEIKNLCEEISSKSYKTRKEVNRKLSRFFNRAHPWSPRFQQTGNRVELWMRIRYSKNKVSTSLTIIKTLSIKLGDYSGPYTTKTQVIKKLKDAKKARKIFLKGIKQNKSQISQQN